MTGWTMVHTAVADWIAHETTEMCGTDRGTGQGTDLETGIEDQGVEIRTIETGEETPAIESGRGAMLPLTPNGGVDGMTVESGRAGKR